MGRRCEERVGDLKAPRPRRERWFLPEPSVAPGAEPPPAPPSRGLLALGGSVLVLASGWAIVSLPWLGERRLW